jgi:hypothetical protein
VSHEVLLSVLAVAGFAPAAVVVLLSLKNLSLTSNRLTAVRDTEFLYL